MAEKIFAEVLGQIAPKSAPSTAEQSQSTEAVVRQRAGGTWSGESLAMLFGPPYHSSLRGAQRTVELRKLDELTTVEEVTAAINPAVEQSIKE